MIEAITLAPESIEAVAQRTAELLGAAKCPEMSTADAMQLTRHKSQSSFYRWAKLRRVKSVAPGRYRRTALLRALGA